MALIEFAIFTIIFFLFLLFFTLLICAFHKNTSQSDSYLADYRSYKLCACNRPTLATR